MSGRDYCIADAEGRPPGGLHGPAPASASQAGGGSRFTIETLVRGLADAAIRRP
jgi:hypothetical protein